LNGTGEKKPEKEQLDEIFVEEFRKAISAE